jgi:hypothetical protein
MFSLCSSFYLFSQAEENKTEKNVRGRERGRKVARCFYSSETRVKSAAGISGLPEGASVSINRQREEKK